MKKYHDIQNVRIQNDIFCFEVDHSYMEIPLKDMSSRLSAASEQEKNTFEVSPSGYGFHWPLLDEDLSVDGLLLLMLLQKAQ